MPGKKGPHQVAVLGTSAIAQTIVSAIVATLGPGVKPGGIGVEEHLHLVCYGVLRRREIGHEAKVGQRRWISKNPDGDMIPWLCHDGAMWMLSLDM